MKGETDMDTAKLLDHIPDESWRLVPLHVVSAHGPEALLRRLRLEIDQFDPGERERIRRAARLAERLHAHDRRLSGEPYLHHVLRVPLRLITRWRVQDADLVVAALLHDTAEDHPGALAGGAPLNPVEAALAVIGRDFGARVAELVAAVTNPPNAPGLDRDERDRLYRAHVVETLTGLPEARLIKVSDFVDNAGGVFYGPLDRARRYASKYTPLVPQLQELIQQPDTPLHPEVKACVVQQLGRIGQRLSPLLAPPTTMPS